jgi:hypothetical protein
MSGDCLASAAVTDNAPSPTATAVVTFSALLMRRILSFRWGTPEQNEWDARLFHAWPISRERAGSPRRRHTRIGIRT